MDRAIVRIAAPDGGARWIMGKKSSKSGAGGNGGGVALAEKEQRVSENARKAGESAPGRRPAATPGGARRGFFDIYKPGQGYHTRVVSGFVLGALVCWGSYALYDKLSLLDNKTVQVFIPVGVIIALGLAGYWALALKRSICEFLIATEGEMKKVNWTSRKEIIGSTKVVIFLVVAMSSMLFTVDLFFMSLFTGIGVLKGTSVLDVIGELF